ncbi:MAG TPA: ATP-binding protein [Polyangia bacterium]|nr:ATP-binding protein [Polyangia bacterium]
MSDSIESLEEAVRALPENLALRRQLAAALEKAGDADRALAEYDAILTRADGDAPANLGRARCLYEVGRHAEALEAYDAAVARDVSLADAALEGKIRRAKDDPRARIRLVADGGEKKPAEEPKVEAGEVEKPTITFADVGGLDELKEKVRLRVLYPLKRPDLYKAFGKKVGGGLLLYGPPGCGKTFLARATAGEAGIHFVAVGIEEVLDMWLGQSEKKLHELFRTARAKAPAILFFDEVDSLGGRRSGLRHESYRTLVTQFLSELDGANGQSEGVLVIGATNAPWDVDPAFRRPGRFGEVLFVPPPDLRARVEILKLKLAGKPVAPDVDVAEIARATELSSGADLDHVVQSAIETALAESLRGGAVRTITTADLRAASKKIKPTTLEWFSTAKNFATYANDSGQFDEVLDYLKRHRL